MYEAYILELFYPFFANKKVFKSASANLKHMGCLHVCVFVFVCAFDLCGRNKDCFSSIVFLQIEAHEKRIITNRFTFIDVQASPITLFKLLTKTKPFKSG